MAETSEMIELANALKRLDVNPLPWSGEWSVPLTDTGEEDAPFIIRDANGSTVLLLFEQIEHTVDQQHVMIGERIVAAVNALAPAPSNG